MSNLPVGFYEGELYCFPIGPERDRRFAVIPGPPTVELSGGRLATDLTDIPDDDPFSLQCVWQVEPQALERVRTAIAARYPDASEITLDVADLRAVHATLTIGGTDGNAHVIGHRSASGSTANRVVFSEPLASAERLAVTRALGGDAGILILGYTGSLILQETVAVKIQGDLAQAIKVLSLPPQKAQYQGWFSKKMPAPPPVYPTFDTFISAIDHAFAQGELRVVNTSTANVTQQACDDALAALRLQLAKMLADRLMQLGENAAYLSSFPIAIKHAATEQMQFDIARSADVGVWAQHYE